MPIQVFDCLEAIVVKKIILLLVVTVIGSSGWLVQAQELLSPPDPADLPPQIGYQESGGSSVLEPIASGDLQGPGVGHPDDEAFQLFGADIALLESSGTWLRRGFWYTEVDVVLADRIWRRDNMELMSQQVGRTTDQIGRTVFQTNDLLIEGGRYGTEATPRMKLGRFLFRDAKNRDHSAEFVAYGGGQWSQGGRLDVNPSNDLNTTTLFVNQDIDRGNISFDGAKSSEYQYDSRMNSFELNYHVKMRMRRDRMELEPNGHWIRRAQPTNSHSLIAGIRYMDISEDINWTAFGIPVDENDPGSQSGTYRVRTGNDLLGTQLGFTWSHDRARWSLGFRGKSGVFIAASDEESSFDITNNITSGGSSINDDNLSFLTEGAAFAKWHLRPNFSLRVGVEGLFLTSLALAPDQLNFAPTSTAELIADGHAIFLGGSIGFEGYW